MLYEFNKDMARAASFTLHFSAKMIRVGRCALRSQGLMKLSDRIEVAVGIRKRVLISKKKKTRKY